MVGISNNEHRPFDKKHNEVEMVGIDTLPCHLFLWFYVRSHLVRTEQTWHITVHRHTEHSWRPLDTIGTYEETDWSASTIHLDGRWTFPLGFHLHWGYHIAEKTSANAPFRLLFSLTHFIKPSNIKSILSTQRTLLWAHYATFPAYL